MCNFILRAVWDGDNGVVEETELTIEQAVDLAGGKAVCYVPRPVSVRTEDGTIVHRETAVPELPEAA